MRKRLKKKIDANIKRRKHASLYKPILIKSLQSACGGGDLVHCKQLHFCTAFIGLLPR